MTETRTITTEAGTFTFRLMYMDGKHPAVFGYNADVEVTGRQLREAIVKLGIQLALEESKAQEVGDDEVVCDD